MKITLVMMVRNEAKTIEDTLRSWLPVADNVVVVDTGSTDGTKNMALDALIDWVKDGSMPGFPRSYLVPAPAEWVDFATNRNEALALAAKEFPGTWLLMVDADTRLHGAATLRSFLDVHPDQAHDSYKLRTMCGNLSYPMHRVFLAESLWFYVGAVHEAPVHSKGNQPGPTIPGCYQEYVGTDGGTESKRRAWREHLRILSRELLDSASPRATFYAAQTHACLGEEDAAEELYRIRWEMTDGYEPERWRAGLCLARLTRDDQEAAQLFATLAALRPWRAEPWYEIGLRYLDRCQELSKALAYALIAAALPEPAHDEYMIETDVYQHKARLLKARCHEAMGNKEIARTCYQDMLTPCLPEADRLFVKQRIAVLAGRQG